MEAYNTTPPARHESPVASAPAVVIRLELEAAPRVYVEAASRGERHRLLDWINSNSDLRAIVRAADDLRVIDEDFGYPDVGEVRIPGGLHKGRSLAEVAALGLEGEFWFKAMLARLHADDWMRPAIEQFVRERMPGVWMRYDAWRLREAAAA